MNRVHWPLKSMLLVSLSSVFMSEEKSRGKAGGVSPSAVGGAAEGPSEGSLRNKRRGRREQPRCCMCNSVAAVPSSHKRGSLKHHGFIISLLLKSEV